MSLPPIFLHDKQFLPYLSAPQLAAAVREVAEQINRDYASRQPLLVTVLNGAFMFAADLMKALAIDCEITFIRLASYEGTSSTGHVKELLGLAEDVAGRHLIVVEDIVDTGHTMQKLLDQLAAPSARLAGSSYPVSEARLPAAPAAHPLRGPPDSQRLHRGLRPRLRRAGPQLPRRV